MEVLLKIHPSSLTYSPSPDIKLPLDIFQRYIPKQGQNSKDLIFFIGWTHNLLIFASPRRKPRDGGMHPPSWAPDHTESAAGFEAKTRKPTAKGGFEVHTTKPSLHALRGMSHPWFVTKPVKPFGCRHVSNLSSSLDPSNVPHSCCTSNLLDFTIIPLNLANVVFITMHSCSSMHHASLPWLCPVSSIPMVQAYSCSPQTFRLTFTSHRRPSCRQVFFLPVRLRLAVPKKLVRLTGKNNR